MKDFIFLSQSQFHSQSFMERATLALPNWPQTVVWISVSVVGTLAFLTMLALSLVYAERKIAAHFQCRLGPMRVGWHGMLQSIADTIKLLFKEDIIPQKADVFLFVLAPIITIMGTLLSLAVIPVSPNIQVTDLNIGIVYLAGVAGLGVLGVLLAGWSSNSKWSMLGAMRAGAQMLSYELSATLALLVIVLFSGTLSLREVVESQQQGWWIWRGHFVTTISFLIFLIASVAELNRTPFDLAEGESELTGGFHTEYSGLRWSYFFLAEFINMFVAAAVASTLFLGGWMPFHIGEWHSFNAVMDLIPPVIWFAGKVGFLIFVMMWFRWTFPRLRIDQMMRLEWKILLPIGLCNLLLAASIVLAKWYFFPNF